MQMLHCGETSFVRAAHSITVSLKRIRICHHRTILSDDIVCMLWWYFMSGVGKVKRGPHQGHRCFRIWHPQQGQCADECPKKPGLLYLVQLPPLHIDVPMPIGIARLCTPAPGGGLGTAGDLRRIDNGAEVVHAIHPQVGDGEGASRHLVRGQLVVLCLRIVGNSASDPSILVRHLAHSTLQPVTGSISCLLNSSEGACLRSSSQLRGCQVTSTRV